MSDTTADDGVWFGDDQSPDQAQTQRAPRSKKLTNKWLKLFDEFISALRIVSKEVAAQDEKGVKLELWGSQRMALESLCDGMDAGIRNFMFLKGRQAGISTVFLAIDLFWLAMHPNTIGALVVDRDDNAAKFRQVLQQYHASFPKKFLGSRFTIVKDNKNFMQFSNGSRLDFIVAGKKKNYGEGQGYVLVHATEVASYGSQEGLASFKETLAEKNPNRLFIWESTAKGFNHWRDMWEEFGRDTHTKSRCFIGWWAKELNRIERGDKRFQVYGTSMLDETEKERSEQVKKQFGVKITMEQWAWHRWRRSEGDRTDSDAKQNQPTTPEEAFVFSGHLFFQGKKLQDDLLRAEQIPFHGFKYIIGNDFWSVQMEKITDRARLDEITLRIWEEPEDDATYAIGVDPSIGGNAGADRHCITIWRCFADCMVQVAEFADNMIETRHCAWILAHLCGAYKNCWLNIEITGGHGRVIMTEFDHLREMLRLQSEKDAMTGVLIEKYERPHDWVDFLGMARWYIYQRADTYTAGRSKGFDTRGGADGGRKLDILLQLRDKHATDQLIIRSVKLIQEMVTITQNGLEVKALGRNKDDRVLAAALANRIWIDNVMLPMMAQGQTYDIVMAVGDENIAPVEVQLMNRIVQNFWSCQEEMASMPTDEEEWYDRRGFLK